MGNLLRKSVPQMDQTYGCAIKCPSRGCDPVSEGYFLNSAKEMLRRMQADYRQTLHRLNTLNRINHPIAPQQRKVLDLQSHLIQVISEEIERAERNARPSA